MEIKIKGFQKNNENENIILVYMGYIYRRDKLKFIVLSILQ